MKLSTAILVLPIVMYATFAFAQERHSWGRLFSCSVDWFTECKTQVAEMPSDAGATRPRYEPEPPKQILPTPVRNVLENPSLETAKKYVTYVKEAQEKLAKATAYISQVMRETRTSNSVPSNARNMVAGLSGLGPMGLYYFFSPTDRTAAQDVQVLNKIFQAGSIGVVGIPVAGRDDEILAFVRGAGPLFPVRRSDAEVQMIKPTETPELHLALPLRKKITRLNTSVDEAAIHRGIAAFVEKESVGTLPGE